MAADESQKHKRGEARNEDRTVRFASLMDVCISRIQSWNQSSQKYKGRVVLRGDIVKDDSGAYAVFTEPDSSASQMTAAKVMDVTATLIRCGGQAADAISAYTQAKNEDAPSLLKRSEVRMSRSLDASTETQVAEIMVQCGKSTGSS